MAAAAAAATPATSLASTLPDGGIFFWFSLPFIDDDCAPESGFAFDTDDVRAIDVLVTVALEVAALIADCDDDAEADGNDEVDGVDDDGTLLETK